MPLDETRRIVTEDAPANDYATKHERPWGHFRLLDQGPGFVVKALLVKGEQRLSFQRHVKRAETWTGAMGTARVSIGGVKRELRPGEAVHIPPGVEHRLENCGREPVVVIEVQIGDCDELDITRVSDDYGRTDRPTPDGGHLSRTNTPYPGRDAGPAGGRGCIVPLREPHTEVPPDPPDPPEPRPRGQRYI